MSSRWRRAVGGLLLVVVGAVVVLVSLVSLALSSCGTLVSEGSIRPRSPGVAVVVSSSDLVEESAVGGLFCDADYDRLTVRVGARPVERQPLFVGVAPANAAQRYLRAARYDRTDLDLLLSEARYRPAGGAEMGLDKPEQQRFWRAEVRPKRSAVVRLTYAWTVPETFWVVLMNASGSRRVVADTSLQVEVAGPRTWPYLVAALAGFATVAAGIRLAVTRPRRRLERDS